MVPSEYSNAWFNGNNASANSLARQLLAPHDEKELEWIRTHTDWLTAKHEPNPDRHHWILRGAKNHLPSDTYSGNTQHYAVYKTCKHLVSALPNNQIACRTLVSLLTHIVWSRLATKPDKKTLYDHTIDIRRTLLELAARNEIPALSTWRQSNQWLPKIIAGLSATTKKENSFRTGLEFLLKILDGKVRYGQKQRTGGATKRSIKMIDEINRNSPLAWSANHFIDTNKGTVASEKVQVSSPPANADDVEGRPIEVKLGSSALSDKDAGVFSQHIAGLLEMARVEGPFRKETDTWELASYKLGLFHPDSLEAQTLILMLILGRPNLKGLLVGSKSSQTISLPSLLESDATVEITVPPTFNISEIVSQHAIIAKKIQRTAKKHGLYGSPSKAAGIGRFGRFAFHAKLGAVVSAQLSGDFNAVKVTSQYCQLSEADYQTGFNTIYEALINWLGDGTHAGECWGLWAALQSHDLPCATLFPRKQGSTRILRPQDICLDSIKHELEKCYRPANRRTSMPDAIIGYLSSSAHALLCAAQMTTGIRPASSAMRIAVSDSLLVVADKKLGKFHPSRMICVHFALTQALKKHMKNVFTFIDAHSKHDAPPQNVLPHPFYTATNRHGQISAQPITTSTYEEWLACHTLAKNPKANGLRHAQITDMQLNQNQDGYLTQQVNHERRAVSLLSRHQSTASALPCASIDCWVPQIRDLTYDQ